MNLTAKEVNKIKIKLALEGTGSKGRMALNVGCANCQITKLLNTGFIPDKFSDKVKMYL